MPRSVFLEPEVTIEFSETELQILCRSLMRSPIIGAGDLMDDILQCIDEQREDIAGELSTLLEYEPAHIEDIE